MTRLGLLLIAMTLPVPGFVLAAPEQVEKRGDTEARAQLDRDSIDLSGMVTVTVSIEGKAPLEIEPLKTITTSRAWVVTPPAGPQTSSLPGGRMRWEQSFRMTPLQDQKVELPLEPLRFRTASGKAETVNWKPFTVQVSTLVSSTSLSAIKDIAGPEQLPEPPLFPWMLVATGVGAPLGLALIGWSAWRLGRRPAALPPELAPHEWALREFGHIGALQPATPEDVERLHTLLADVVRRYLERRFSVRTAERTTAEFLAALAKEAPVTPDQQALLRSVFERCDLAKFARASYPPDECQKTVQIASDFVRQTIPSPRQAAVPVKAG